MRVTRPVTLVKFHGGERLSPHFSGSEFVCPCESCDRTGIIALELIYALERLRADLGCPLRITSGYRCPQHNREIGGAPDSLHQMGLAADIIADSPILEPIDVAMAAIKAGFTGVIVYKDKHVHVDLRMIPYFQIGGDADGAD